MCHIDIAATAHVNAALYERLRQFEGDGIALLVGNELVDGHHFRRIDEGTLYADGLVALQEEHVAATDELVGSHAVENGLRVDALCHLEGDAGREVGLDGTRDDVRRRALGGDNHVDADGTRFLGNTGYRQLDFLAGGHDEVTVLVNDNDDVRHVFMSVLRIELTGNELLVIVLDVTLAGCHQQLVAGIHLHTE